MTDFTKYEYQDKLRQMTELLKNKDGWGDAYDSTMGQTLIQMMVDVTDSLHYMLERRTAESFLETAKLRSSVIARSCELGYRYRRAVANSGEVEIILQGENEAGDVIEIPAEADLIIPRFTELTNDGISYFTDSEITIPVGESRGTVQVRQGQYESVSETINGEDFVLIPEYEYIDNFFLRVREGQNIYLDVVRNNKNVNKRALSFLGPDDQFYDVKYATNGMRVVFGDGTYGKKPDGEVTIDYITVDPENDPIIVIGQEFDFAGVPPTDLDGNSYDFSLVNSSSIRGYLPPEDTTAIKRNAVVYHKTNGRATTNDDYTYWVKESGVASIVDARAFGEDELSTLVYNMNNVYITYLKEDGSSLTRDQEISLRQFIDQVKTTQAHVVLNNARRLNIQADISVKKNKSNPISNAEMYDIIYRYMQNRLSLGEGSIGGKIYASNVVNEMYGLTSTNNDVTRQLIEYVKVDLNGIVPFSVPLIGNKSYVTLSTEYVPTTGDRWVLILSNLICEIEIDGTDSTTDILNKMRDRIFEVTPYEARVVAMNVALDAFGNPLPIEIDPTVGETMLIGINTPYNSPDELIEGSAVGTTLARVVSVDPEITVTHYYYSSPAGRRPMIPLRFQTTIGFTAPTDTNVNVYTRVEKDDPATEVLIQEIPAGTYYEFNSTNEHTIQYEYVNDSVEDVTVTIEYPAFETSSSFGLMIASKDGFGEFSLQTSSGDIPQHVNVEYSYQLPVASRNFNDPEIQNVRPESFSVIDPDGTTVISDRGDGRFVNNIGILIPSGSINYRTGEVSLPVNFDNGDYYFKFDQNIYDNFQVDQTTAIDLIMPKPSLASNEFSLSTIRIE